ncbi:BEN domain-containing protein 7 isoform X3 [Artibeus jamaicensis]|uniref:BEN domain-containing protein 7 isoform X3 n=1 Tax=Artibeus jamaicensis TaxID=9417 RepID=UPI00235A6F5C|nr:BEN domain-containing protein 7 isoform X3 [Artibeus jamaicensis]
MAAAALRQQVAPGSRRRHRLLPAPLLPRGRSAPRPGSHPVAAAAAFNPPPARPPRPQGRARRRHCRVPSCAQAGQRRHPGAPAAPARSSHPQLAPQRKVRLRPGFPRSREGARVGGLVEGTRGAAGRGQLLPGKRLLPSSARRSPREGSRWFFPSLGLPPADSTDGPWSRRSRCWVTRAQAAAATASAAPGRSPAYSTMEFSERKRSRKSQSFKLVSGGGESMEIKKQITGMRRLLNDSTGRIYQRVGKEGEKLKEEPQDLDSVWPQRLNSAEAPQTLHPSSRGAWNELPAQSGQFSGQSGPRARTFQSQSHTAGSSNGELPVLNSSAGSNCCTCNCQSTLQAILQELKTMRKLMQIQAVGTQNRQQPPISLICSQRTAVSRKRNKKKKVPPKTVEPLTVKQKPSVLETEKKTAVALEQPALQAAEHTSASENHVLGFGIVLESPSSDPEVQLAEGFDVFMPKSQLDSILSNYTRSGSLLFRKLVCAFFDDKTLANSLPNGKRKRGLNDNRKGLDQNIVGAIKVFTEKYCTANHVDKLPGPRDWVQILQDQIKLARRRLKRGSAEAADGDERLDGISLPPTGKKA